MKTVKVKIAVAVDECGCWYAYGENSSTPDESAGEARGWVHDDGCVASYFVEAELPVPKTTLAVGPITITPA
jgi:hypothetical protein